MKEIDESVFYEITDFKYYLNNVKRESSNTINAYITDLKVGETIQLDISKNMANSVSLIFDGAILNGESIPQVISIKNESDVDLYLRAKVFIFSQDNKNMQIDINQTINWYYNENDGYFYFNSLLKSGEKVSLCSDVVTPEDCELNTNKKYILTVLFESLDQIQNVDEIWSINPIENVWQVGK